MDDRKKEEAAAENFLWHEIESCVMECYHFLGNWKTLAMLVIMRRDRAAVEISAEK